MSVVKSAGAAQQDASMSRATGAERPVPDSLPIAPADAAENRRVRHKLDAVIMPLVCTLVLFQLTDKLALNYVKVLGLEHAVNLHGQDYSWLGSIFYFGYLLGSVVHGIAFQYVPLAPYLSLNCVVWGIILACHARCTTFAQLVGVRILLGLFESCVYSGFILYMGHFYTKREQVVRISVWYSMTGWGTVLGALIMYGVVKHPSPHIEQWQEVYVILGVITVALGLVALAMLPESVDRTRYLSPRERAVALHRIASNHAGFDGRKFQPTQLREALLDLRLYLFFLVCFCVNVANGGLITFCNTLIVSIFHDVPRSTLLGMAQGAANVVFSYLGILLFSLTRLRAVPVLFGLVWSVIGSAILYAVPVTHKATSMAGVCLSLGFAATMSILFSWAGTSVAGSTKRIAFTAMLQLAWGAGNIVGPQTYLHQEAPLYHTAKATMLGMFCASVLFLVPIPAMHGWWNRQRAARAAGQRTPKPHDEQQEIGEEDLLDRSDKEHPGFIYPC